MLYQIVYSSTAPEPANQILRADICHWLIGPSHFFLPYTEAFLGDWSKLQSKVQKASMEPEDPRLLASGPLHVLVVDSRTACRKATVGLLEQVSYKVGELY